MKSYIRIFLANGSDGLRSYTFDGTSFTNTAHINPDSSAEKVSIAADGTIFIASGWNGLRAYNFEGSSFIQTAHINNVGCANDIVITDKYLIVADMYGLTIFDKPAGGDYINNDMNLSLEIALNESISEQFVLLPKIY